MAIIDKPSDYFETKLYTGTGSEQSITMDFAPDLSWLKRRNGVGSHRLFDVVRGATKEIFADATLAESTDAQSLKSFDSDGFTLGTGGATNGSGNTYASWNWKAGGTAVSNTDGSITSSVSANQDAGFSIVSYTGTGSNATVGHGLSSAPRMVLVKNRNTTNSWEVFHASMGATKVILLNRNEAEQTSSSSWNNTAPTSSVFSIGTAAGTNGNGNSLIAYCLAEKQGYSKFGSYTGNGSTDGTFVYTGFKPAFVMCKRTNSTGVWFMCDNKRVGFNGRPNNTASVGNPELSANDSRSEAGGNTNVMDIFSNGFKLIQSGAEINGSGQSFIFMAFASNPFVTSTGVPATAR